MIPLLVERARLRKALRDTPVPVLDAVTCIKKALTAHPGKVALSWSGGKCSTAVLFMALKLDPKIVVQFSDTGVHFPETYAFVKYLSEEWALNFQRVKAETTFWKCVKEYGFPMFRGKYTKSSRSKDGKPKCCTLLKERPFQTFLKAHNYEAAITGIRAAESRMRMFGIAQFGQYYYAKTLKHWRYHPIAFWTQERLDTFHQENDIPMNKIYSMGHERCGCWCCTGYLTWRRSLRQSHPKMYRWLSKQTGQPTLWEYYDNESCRQFLVDEGLL